MSSCKACKGTGTEYRSSSFGVEAVDCTVCTGNGKSPSRVNPRVLLMIGVVGVLVLVAGALLLRNSNVVPHGVPLIGKDSGIAFCENAAESRKNPMKAVAEPSPGQSWSEAEYKKARATFASSRYDVLRENGVKLMDGLWRVTKLAEKSEVSLETMNVVQEIATSYNNLASGCADHGYIIPTLSELEEEQ